MSDPGVDSGIAGFSTSIPETHNSDQHPAATRITFTDRPSKRHCDDFLTATGIQMIFLLVQLIVFKHVCPCVRTININYNSFFVKVLKKKNIYKNLDSNKIIVVLIFQYPTSCPPYLS